MSGGRFSYLVPERGRRAADRAGINVNTISRYEAGYEILTGTMQKIEDALRDEGVVFLDETEDFGPTIRVRKVPVPSLHSSPNPFATLKKKQSRQRNNNLNRLV